MSYILFVAKKKKNVVCKLKKLLWLKTWTLKYKLKNEINKSVGKLTNKIIEIQGDTRFLFNLKIAKSNK